MEKISIQQLSTFFGKEPVGEPFRIFSLSHLSAIALIVLFIFLSCFILKRERFRRYRKHYRYIIVFLLIIQEISYQLWHCHVEDFHWGTHLPLHLCGIAVFISILLMITKDYTLYEVLYFWGLAGVTQAILTPDIGIYGFPHYRFFHIFLSHGLVISTVFYMTIVERFRPVIASIKKVFIIINIYFIFIIFINIITDGNYLFICRKPETPSLLDFLGPWPWYILSLEFVGLASLFLLYTPFLLKDYLTKRRELSGNEK
ncbi:MAG: TIGR02206 family membrane protein [Candidatus Omnitrophota bacterium]|nr:MAG: TIGR02206 family membrane protein [Candidatus Omnitrophota bacterium]